MPQCTPLSTTIKVEKKIRNEAKIKNKYERYILSLAAFLTLCIIVTRRQAASFLCDVP
jgi:hypothetical protein